MEPLLTPDEMRAADEAVIARGTSAAELMDRAAHACSVVALRMVGGGYGRRALVVCGKGNNGGDGIACARHLANAGVRTTVFLLAEPSGEAAYHLDLARRFSTSRIETWSADRFAREASRTDLVVDAIFGTGFSGAPKGEAAEAIAAMQTAAPVLAIDIPSGVSGADGSVPGVAVRADATLAIQALKVGHVVAPGGFRCGRIDVADIGVAVDDARAYVPDGGDVAAALPAPEPDTHKYRVGALAVLAGSAGMTGAAILTARGAMRSGAGLVILGVPASSLDVIEGAVIEAIKVPLPDVEGQLEEKAVDEFADRLEKARALAVGPGLGRGPRAVSVLRRAVDVDFPLVVDADGLWALGEILRDEPDVLRRRAHPTVLTPHSGEYAFLAGRPPGPDRVSDVRESASRWGAVVHLKGRRALTAAPDGRVWINTTGNPGAATGGTGDVLTGIVGSFCAQGVEASSAAWAGAYVHGLALDITARRQGSRPLTSTDVPEALPGAFQAFGRELRDSSRIRTVIPLERNA